MKEKSANGAILFCLKEGKDMVIHSVENRSERYQRGVGWEGCPFNNVSITCHNRQNKII